MLDLAFGLTDTLSHTLGHVNWRKIPIVRLTTGLALDVK